MGRVTCSAVLAVAGLLATLGAAHAQPIRETIGLSYDVPEGCPDRASFITRVRDRTPRGELVPEAQATGRVFMVAIDQADVVLRGRLIVRDVEGSTSRTVTGERCEDVLAALVLITALAIDPHPEVEPPPAPDPPPRPRVVRRARPPPPPTPRLWHVDAALGIETSIGVAPDVLPAVPLWIELRRVGLGALRVAGVWGTRRSKIGTATARFTFVAGEVTACPRPLAVGARTNLSGCAGVRAGALRGAGAEIEGASSSTRPWVSAVAAGRARVAIRPWWFAELSIAAGIPIVRDRFFFEPNIEIHTVPVVVGHVGIVLGVNLM